MPKFRRLVVPGYPHHVTQRGVRRQRTFFEDGDFEEYLELAGRRLDEAAIRVWAYCLMPNHIHAIVVPEKASSLAKFFAPLHQQYARSTNRKHDWCGHLWQSRFFSVAMDESHTLEAMRYVELNPVRAGLCDEAHEWAWSSARGNLGLANDPLLDTKAVERLNLDWQKYLGVGENQDRIEDLRRLTRIGRPEGSREFIDSIEAASGRAVRKRSRWQFD